MAEKRTVEVILHKNNNYSVSPANNVWCHETAEGMIFCDFTLEYGEIPEKVLLEITEDGQIKEKKRLFSGENKDISKSIRDLMCGVIMTREAARNIGQFLQDFADGKIKGAIESDGSTKGE